MKAWIQMLWRHKIFSLIYYAIIFFRNAVHPQIEQGESDRKKHTKFKLIYLSLEPEDIEEATGTDCHTELCCFHSLIIFIASFFFMKTRHIFNCLPTKYIKIL